MESLTLNYVHDKDHIFKVLKSDKYSKQFSRQKKESDVIIIEIKDFNDDIQERIKSNVTRYIKIFEEILDIEDNRTIQSNIKNAPALLTRKYEIVIDVQNQTIPIRQLKASNIGKLCVTQGIVTQVTDVLPKLEVATYCCCECGELVFQPISSRVYMPQENCPSKICKTNGWNELGKLTLITRESKFVKVC